MSRNRSHVLRAAVPAAVLVVAAAGLTGCGSGKKTSTMEIRTNAAQGASAESGNIAVRDVYVVPGSDTGSTGSGSSGGSSAGATTGFVVATIANSGDSGQDQLTGVTVNGTQAQPGRAETGSAVTAPTESASASTSASASPSAAASATPSATQSAGAPGASDLTVRPHQVITFTDPTVGGTGMQLQVTGLSDPLLAGQFVKVTFSFGTAGDLTVLAPVQPTTGTTQTATPKPEISLETTTPKAKSEGGGG